MKDIEIYNKYLDKKIFTIKDPMGVHLPGLPAKIKMKIVGTNNYITVGEETEYLTYKIKILPSGQLNSLINTMMRGKTHKVVNIIDVNRYDILLENINLSKTKNITGGGNASYILVPSLFRLLFNYDDSMGEQIGFRNIGNKYSITNSSIKSLLKF
jgi:hypothetical protein